MPFSLSRKYASAVNSASECRLLATLFLSRLLLMKACHCHPTIRPNDAQPYVPGKTPQELAELEAELKTDPRADIDSWSDIVGKAREKLTLARRLAGDLEPGALKEDAIRLIDTHISDISRFTPDNLFNYDDPTDIARDVFKDAKQNPQGVLDNLTCLYTDRLLLPVQTLYTFLFVFRKGLTHDMIPQLSNVNAIVAEKFSAEEIARIGFECEAKGRAYVKQALDSVTYYDYVQLLHSAAPLFRAATVAFEGTCRRLESRGDSGSVSDFESERYAAEEWYACCGCAVQMYGTGIVSGLFHHLHLRGVDIADTERVAQVIEYLQQNEVILPGFCRRAWDSFRENCLPDARELDLIGQMKRYTTCVVSQIDPISREVMEECMRLLDPPGS